MAMSMVPPPVDQDPGGRGVSWVVLALIVVVIGAVFYWLLIRRR